MIIFQIKSNSIDILGYVILLFLFTIKNDFSVITKVYFLVIIYALLFNI